MAELFNEITRKSHKVSQRHRDEMYLKMTEISAAQRWCWTRKQTKYWQRVNVFYNNPASSHSSGILTTFPFYGALEQTRGNTIWATPSHSQATIREATLDDVVCHFSSSVSSFHQTLNLPPATTSYTGAQWAVLKADMRGDMPAEWPWKLSAAGSKPPAASSSLSFSPGQYGSPEGGPLPSERDVQSPHTDVTGQLCCSISKLLSQLEEGTTHSDTGWGSPAKTGVKLHWQDHLWPHPGHLWIPWHEQAAWPENTISQGESPVAH